MSNAVSRNVLIRLRPGNKMKLFKAAEACGISMNEMINQLVEGLEIEEITGESVDLTPFVVDATLVVEDPLPETPETPEIELEHEDDGTPVSRDELQDPGPAEAVHVSEALESAPAVHEGSDLGDVPEGAGDHEDPEW